MEINLISNTVILYKQHTSKKSIVLPNNQLVKGADKTQIKITTHYKYIPRLENLSYFKAKAEENWDVL
jgi:hypothetical protein